MISASVPKVRINGNAPLWRIVDSLAGSGWGELRQAPQSVRTYLLAFARVADARSGNATVTDAQLSERTGLSIRTIERARTWLVAREYIQVLRRGARQGRVGVASILHLAKDALLELIPGARVAKDTREATHAAREGGFKGRLGTWSKRPQKGRQKAAERVVEVAYTKVSSEVRQRNYIVEECEHGGEAGLLASGVAKCPMCRRK